jgi:hypothetical protein
MFEDTNGTIRSHRSKDRQYNNRKENNIKRKTTAHKTLNWKLKIQQHEPHLKPEVNSGAPEA